MKPHETTEKKKDMKRFQKAVRKNAKCIVTGIREGGGCEKKNEKKCGNFAITENQCSLIK